jgi:hypothetical protein
LYFVPPLWHSYIAESRTTFAKAYEIKVRWYGEHVGEHIGNLMGTHWELKGNIMRTIMYSWKSTENMNVYMLLIFFPFLISSHDATRHLKKLKKIN